MIDAPARHEVRCWNCNALLWIEEGKPEVKGGAIICKCKCRALNKFPRLTAPSDHT